jgi:hypothetical protein
MDVRYADDHESDISAKSVRGFGFAALTSNALASVGLFLQIPVSFAFSWVSDH